MADPLILTARFDAAAAGTFQRLRDAHFPARLNIVPAHCTLFHHLPGDELGSIAAALGEHGRATSPMPFQTRGLRFLGRGVALLLSAAPLVALRRDLASLFADGLTQQDQQPYHPHVTVQNKAEPLVARALLARLEAEDVTVVGTIVGLDLWHYRGGPWEAAGFAPFSAGAGPDGETSG